MVIPNKKGVISITPRVNKRLEKAGAIKRKNKGQRKRFFAQTVIILEQRTKPTKQPLSGTIRPHSICYFYYHFQAAPVAKGSLKTISQEINHANQRPIRR